MKDTTLKQFVRDRKGDPRGMVIATVIDNTVRFGWSYTNTKAGDRFNKQKAIVIATGRAEKGWGQKVKTPHRVNKALRQIAERSVRYYKGVPLA
jgi:hypothetical protein